MASIDVEHTGGQADVIDTGWRREPADAPSARFGWFGSATKTFYGAAIFFAAFLLGTFAIPHANRS